MAELNLADEIRSAQVAWSPANHAIGTNWEGGRYSAFQTLDLGCSYKYVY
jgi:hypothetical protein